MNRFVLEDEDIIILGEKETQNDTSNNLDSNSLDSGANDDFHNEPTSKNVNGGVGSGNFGHSGRPGKVGGSGKFSGINISDQTVSAKWVKEHREFLKSQGYTDSTVDELVRTAERSELKRKAEKAKTTDKFDKIVDEMKEKGYYTDTWWDAVGKHTRESIKSSMERKEKAVSPEQQKAIDDLLTDTMVYMKPNDEKWLRQNVPKEMVEHLHNELNSAFEEGLSRNVRISFTEAKYKQGSCTVEGPNYDTVLVRLTKSMMSNPEGTLETINKKGESGTRWWTAKKGQVEGIIRHELGHALAWQALKNQGENVFRYDSFNGKIVYNAKRSFAGLSSDSTVYGSDLPTKSAVKLSQLKMNKGLEYLSKYGRKNSCEAIAESYTNPDYSEFTKAVYTELKKMLKG